MRAHHRTHRTFWMLLTRVRATSGCTTQTRNQPDKEPAIPNQYALCSHLTYDPYMDAPGYPNSSFITNYLRIYDLETGELVDTIRMKVHGEPMWQLIANHLHWHGYSREQFFCWWRADFEADGTLNDPPRKMQLMELPPYGFARFAGSRLEHIA